MVVIYKKVLRTEVCASERLFASAKFEGQDNVLSCCDNYSDISPAFLRIRKYLTLPVCSIGCATTGGLNKHTFYVQYFIVIMLNRVFLGVFGGIIGAAIQERCFTGKGFQGTYLLKLWGITLLTFSITPQGFNSLKFTGSSWLYSCHFKLYL